MANKQKLQVDRVSWGPRLFLIHDVQCFYCPKRDHWCLENGISHEDKHQIVKG